MILAMTEHLTTKYPVKLGDTLYPAGTLVRRADLKMVRKSFPKIDYKKSSNFVAVIFPEKENFTIAPLKSLNFPIIYA